MLSMVSQIVSMGWRDAVPPEILPTALAEVPRGRITEIFGAGSSGRTTALHSILAASTRLGEFAVLIDANDAFDPCSAATGGVELDRLTWIRCSGDAGHAMRAADLVIHAGGFGMVGLDLAGASESALSRIPSTTWFRWRRAIESTPTVLTVIATRPLTKSCSALLIEMKRRRAIFTGNLLCGVEYELAPRKPIGKEGRGLDCTAL